MNGAQGPETPMRPVGASNVENELTLLWREAASGALAAGGAIVARNSVLTLVVFAGGDESAPRIVREVESVTHQIASRAVIIMSEMGRSYGAPFDVSVGITQREGAGAQGEQILIRASEEAVPHLPGVVLPLILSGLPSFLWWSGEPPWRTELLEALVDGCERMIVDTAEAGHGERALAALNDLVRRKKTSTAFSDLNWARQTPWRELTAQFFDDRQLLPYLEGIDRVTIEYAAGEEDQPTNAAQGYLFAGWLASRLGWQPLGAQGHGVDAARQYIFVGANGRHIAMEINARFGVPLRRWLDIASSGIVASSSHDGRQFASGQAWPAVGPGALMSVHLHATAQGQPGAFAVAREADLEHASTLCQAGAAYPSHTVSLPALGEASRLVEQLQQTGHDSIFEEALVMAAQLTGPADRRRTT
jgi:glucose-6-phosphate dehydrogenase assembly protein OpcA